MIFLLTDLSCLNDSRNTRITMFMLLNKMNNKTKYMRNLYRCGRIIQIITQYLFSKKYDDIKVDDSQFYIDANKTSKEVELTVNIMGSYISLPNSHSKLKLHF